VKGIFLGKGRWQGRLYVWELFCRGRQFLLCPLQSRILQDEPKKKSAINNATRGRVYVALIFPSTIPFNVGEFTQCERSEFCPFGLYDSQAALYVSLSTRPATRTKNG
jgi:hypothetical protein